MNEEVTIHTKKTFAGRDSFHFRSMPWALRLCSHMRLMSYAVYKSEQHTCDAHSERWEVKLLCPNDSKINPTPDIASLKLICILLTPRSRWQQAGQPW
jgi:hypothetical protein